MYYALGAVLAIGKRPETIEVNIVQPRAVHPGGIIRTYTFSWDELVAFKKELFTKARATLEDDAPRHVGEWCKFCKALPVCPEQHANAIEVAQTEFDTLPAALPPAPEHLTQEQILLVLDRASIIEDWFKSIRSFVQSGLEQGIEVPGWKLVPKRANRKWTPEEEGAIVTYLAEKGLDEEQIFVKKLVSPAQAEKALKVRAPRGQKKHVKLPEEYVQKKSSGNTLAPTGDARPAVVAVAAEDEFEALPPGDV